MHTKKNTREKQMFFGYDLMAYADSMQRKNYLPACLSSRSHTPSIYMMPSARS